MSYIVIYHYIHFWLRLNLHLHVFNI